MPFKKKYRRHLKRKSKKFLNRKKWNARVKRNSGNQIVNARFRVLRDAYNPSDNIYNNANNGVGLSLSGHIANALTDFPGSSAYRNLFAQFRIKKIRIQFFPQVGRVVQTIADSITGNPSVANEKPFFYTTINRVATSFPQSATEILTTSAVKYGPMGKYYERYYSPTVLQELYRQQTVTSAALGPVYNKWISTNYADIKYHGLSWVVGIANGIPSELYKYKVVVTAYAQFKNRRVYTGGAEEGDDEQSDHSSDQTEDQPPA